MHFPVYDTRYWDHIERQHMTLADLGSLEHNWKRDYRKGQADSDIQHGEIELSTQHFDHKSQDTGPCIFDPDMLCQRDNQSSKRILDGIMGCCLHLIRNKGRK